MSVVRMMSGDVINIQEEAVRRWRHGQLFDHSLCLLLANAFSIDGLAPTKLLVEYDLGVGLMIAMRDGVYMQKRLKPTDPFVGRWCFPGGKVQKYEHPFIAVCRETLEETGLDFRPPAIEHLFGGRYKKPDGTPYTAHIFGLHGALGVVPDGHVPLEPHKHTGLRLISWERLNSMADTMPVEIAAREAGIFEEYRQKHFP